MEGLLSTGPTPSSFFGFYICLKERKIPFLFVLVLVLLSASVERFSVSHMRDFLKHRVDVLINLSLACFFFPFQLAGINSRVRQR